MVAQWLGSAPVYLYRVEDKYMFGWWCCCPGTGTGTGTGGNCSPATWTISGVTNNACSDCDSINAEYSMVITDCDLQAESRTDDFPAYCGVGSCDWFWSLQDQQNGFIDLFLRQSRDCSGGSTVLLIYRIPDTTPMPLSGDVEFTKVLDQTGCSGFPATLTLTFP